MSSGEPRRPLARSVSSPGPSALFRMLSEVNVIARSSAGPPLSAEQRAANSPWPIIYSDSTITTGKGGVGGYGMPAGNSISGVKLGPLDRVAPPGINSQSIGFASFPNRIELHWPGVADDPNGVGLYGYQILRD